MKKIIYKLQNKTSYPLRPPILLPGVVPFDKNAPVLAMDQPAYSSLPIAAFDGFPGYSTLAQLTTRAEYRAMAESLSVELTRRWIRLTSSNDIGEQKLKPLEAFLDSLDVRRHIRKLAENDAYFGRGQLYFELRGADSSKPLILDRRTIPLDSFVNLQVIEPIWSTPAAYNAYDALSSDFYKPSAWFVMGREVHASRFSTLITRPLPDFLKPAFNFSGMSLSQLAQPYVDNWLRTRQSVSDLVSNFSVTALSTSMDQILSGDDEDGSQLLSRAELFTSLRTNKGLMLLDKEREELGQINTPLSGLYQLQAQAQEHLCSVSRLPAIILTGISPSGLNATSEGEIRVFYDWINAQQEAHYRPILKKIIDIAQYSLFGEVDPEINFVFNPLYQLSEKEQCEVRKIDSETASNYVGMGVLAPAEERERLRSDAGGLYNAL